MKSVKRILIMLMLLHTTFGGFAQESSQEHNQFIQEGIQHVLNVEYAEAYACFSKVYSDSQKTGDEELMVQALTNMAVCAFWNGELDSCVNHLTKSIEIARKNRDAFAEYSLYSNLYSAYNTKGDMASALQMSLKMDSIAASSKDVRIRFNKLHHLAQEAAEQHNAKLQEHYLLEREKLMNEFSEYERLSAKYNVYNELATFYLGRQNIDKARKYIRLNISTSMTKTDKSILDYMLYADEAIYCAISQKREAAFAALDSVRFGLEHCKDAMDVHWMSYYGNKGDVFTMFQEWNHAIEAYNEALDAVSGKEQYSWPIYLHYLLRLSDAYYKSGQIDEVRRCLQQNVELSKKTFLGDLAYAAALWLLSRFECMQGEFNKACSYYAQSTDIIKKTLAKQLPYISIQERESFWQNYASNLWEMGACALVAGELQSSFTQKSYDALLFSKAFLLETDRSLAMVINQKCSKDEQRMYYEMVNLQSAIKKREKEDGKDKRQIEQLHERISALDKKLSPVISRIGYTSFLNVDYHTVKDMLGDDEAILDFADYEGDVHQYAVFVIKKDQTCPKLIKSFTTEDMKGLVEGKPLDYIYKAPVGDKATELIWSPVSEEVMEKQTIYYIPSGIMHQIALESLPMRDGTRLGEHYRLVRLTSAREISKIKKRKKSSSYKQAVLYGGLTYNMDERAMSKVATRYKVDNLYALNHRGARRGDGEWGDLKNTKEEVETIGKLLNKKNVRTTQMTGTKGTEESFYAMSGKAPHILHFATHGFFYTPDKATEVSFLKGYQDAMLLSGLILAGGNAEWTGKPTPKGVMGGVLTANDIATTDLRGTDLVVLSACQTALGEVTSEGIYGLQRAFKKAGVQTIVMSLWNISDRVTKEFMVKFYEELTAGNGRWNKRRAFENAKEHIRSNPDYHAPYYWAGFVMLD